MKRYIKADVADILDETYLVRLDAANNERTRPQTLARLADDPSEYIRRIVARNPSTPVGALEKLARDPFPDVRKYLISNPKAPTPLVLDTYDRMGNISGEANIYLYFEYDYDGPIASLEASIKDIVQKALQNVTFSTGTKIQMFSFEFVPDIDPGWGELMIRCGMFESQRDANEVDALIIGALEDSPDGETLGIRVLNDNATMLLQE